MCSLGRIVLRVVLVLRVLRVFLGILGAQGGSGHERCPVYAVVHSKACLTYRRTLKRKSYLSSAKGLVFSVEGFRVSGLRIYGLGSRVSSPFG